MWKLRNPFKKKKNPDKVRAGRLGGIKSGEARQLKKLDRVFVNAVLDKNPELLIIRGLGKHYDMEISDKQLISLVPYLVAIGKRLSDREPPIKYDL